MTEERTMYFIQLPRDFYHRREIKLLEAQPNGYAYEIFYQKLMMEALTTNGYLYNTDDIPMDASTLSVLTGMNIDLVRCALPILAKLGLISITDDNSIYIDDVPKMTGRKSGTPAAIRQRLCRERKKAANLALQETGKIESVTECHSNVTEGCDTVVTECHDNNNYNYNYSYTEEEEQHNTSSVSRARAQAPTREEVETFISSKCPHVNPNGFFKYYQKLDWESNGEPIHDWRRVALAWEENLKKEEILPHAEMVKLMAAYKRQFGVSIPPAFLGRVKLIQTAMATDTPLEDSAT